MCANLSSKDIKLLSQLRQNSREQITKMSKTTGIPVTTIHDNLKKYEGGPVKKFSCILNFKELGYDIKVTLALKAKEGSREELRKFLVCTGRLNNLSVINNGYSYLAEMVFVDMNDYAEFSEKLSEHIREVHEYIMLDEVMKESLLDEREQAIMGE
jgi:DNA-binding Lrp family transcriptional regulator